MLRVLDSALLVAFILVTSGFSSALAAPAPARHVVVVLPPAVDADDGGLALAMQARAVALLVRTGGFEDVNAKQILRLAEHEGMSRATLGTVNAAKVIGRRFGAERVVFGQLAKDDKAWVLTVASTSKNGTTSIKLPTDPVKALEDGALAMARLAAGPGTIEPAPPASASAPALIAYFRCYATVVEQPLLVDTPIIVDEARLKDAIVACRAAVGADPAFQEAKAALGLALALAGQDDAAVETLAAVKEDKGYLPLYWLARYWMVTRYESADSGAVCLRAAVAKHPYFLLARGYLAQHESALHHDDSALAAWRDYQKDLPKSAFVRDGISHSLARLGKHDEAIAEARAAAADSPDDREAKREVGSRYIDAGRDQDAIDVLAPLASAPGARAEVMLQLGYAYSRKGDNAKAVEWLSKAEGNATKPSEWRTRAKARLDRGALLVKSGSTDQGQALLVSAQKGGLARYIEAQKNEDLKRMVAEATVAQQGKKVMEFQMQIPNETSPFLLDGAHDITIPGGRPPTAPKMFEVLRF